jgi:archaellum component FlaC
MDNIDQQIAQLPEKLTFGSSVSEASEQVVTDIKNRIKELTDEIDQLYRDNIAFMRQL